MQKPLKTFELVLTRPELKSVNEIVCVFVWERKRECVVRVFFPHVNIVVALTCRIGYVGGNGPNFFQHNVTYELKVENGLKSIFVWWKRALRVWALWVYVCVRIDPCRAPLCVGWSTWGPDCNLLAEFVLLTLFSFPPLKIVCINNLHNSCLRGCQRWK